MHEDRFRRIQRRRIESAEREISFMKETMRSEADSGARREYRRWLRRARRERDLLVGELRAAEAVPSARPEPDSGTLPDFVIVGAQKGGTAFLYHLLTRHPLVGPATYKEVHFFDRYFELGPEWYRWRFPQPREREDRTTITGEATPYYLFHPLAPERMARVVPDVKLIALLRNPVDRAYSHYQMQVQRGTEKGTFEEALAAEGPRMGEGDGDWDSFEYRHFSYLSRGLYAEQLERWFRVFGKDRMLVLKSEDFFAQPAEVLRAVQRFLSLPERKPDASELGSGRHEGGYRTKMDPATRRRLKAHFEPHNERLYRLLGKDLGW